MPNDGFIERFLLWSAICGVSAAPSFILAAHRFDELGMLLGILVYVVFYTWVSGTPFAHFLLQDQAWEKSLRSAFGFRFALSFIVWIPPLIAVELFPGMFAMRITELAFNNPTGPMASFVTTLIQGLFLNLGILIVVCFVFKHNRKKYPDPLMQGICPKCGYDLRGTPDRCPECGSVPKMEMQSGTAAA
jgi:hypothetical protein